MKGTQLGFKVMERIKPRDSPEKVTRVKTGSHTVTSDLQRRQIQMTSFILGKLV